MRTLIALILVTASLGATSQDITTFVLVRHAEKMVSEDRNPDLTSRGYQRAAQLSDFLSAIDLDAIYSTDYHRTLKTVDPISRSRDITAILYDPSDLQAFADKLIAEHPGETVLVSGHSNTTPLLINLLLGRSVYSNLQDSEYDWVFVVDLVEKGNGKVKKFKLTLD